MKKIILFIACFFIFSFGEVVGAASSSLTRQYENFYTQVQKKYPNNIDGVLNVLEKLSVKIDTLSQKTTNIKTKKNLGELLIVNKNKITSLKISKIKQSVEGNIINNTPYIQELIKNNYTFLILNEFQEYKENNITYRFNFSKYYPVDQNNYTAFIKNKMSNAFILRYNGDFIITNDYKIEKKYSYQELYTLFNNKIDLKVPYTLINGEYFSYKYNYYSFFDSRDGLYLSDLERNKISPEKTLLIKDIDGKYIFSNEYKKLRLTSAVLLENITNKNEFIFNIMDDNKFFDNNYDNILQDIKKLTQDITQGLQKDDEKIQVIYNWIVDNITYYKDFTNGNKQVFSGLLTYKNRTGVCDGYTKLFSYMLSFAGIDDVEIKRGFAFDAVEFPDFGHAWVRIGKYYYDPTFDDPLGIERQTPERYMYYKIPYDLMYVNRFDGIVIPEKYKTLSLDQRKLLVNKNMYQIYHSYKDYPLMARIKNRIELGFTYDEIITLEKLVKKIGVHEVKNFTFFEKDGSKRMIASLKFYPLHNKNIDIILSDTSLNVSEMKLLEWNVDGGKEYRLAYNLRYH